MTVRSADRRRLWPALLSCSIAMVAAAVSAPPASAQSSGAVEVARLEVHDWWGVYVDESGAQKFCFAASEPERTSSSQELKNRGEHYLFVVTVPGAGVRNEVSVRLGYPTDAARDPVLTIDGRRFTMFSDNGEAWLDSAEVDRVAVDAMRRGLKATIEARSRRGTEISDEYNLRGFTAAVNAAARLCQ